MRPELNQIERIELYLNNDLTSAEKQSFESEIEQNPQLKEAVENQSLMVRAIERKALMAHVIAAVPPQVPPRDGSFLSKFKWPIILSSIVVGGLITWVSLRSDENLAKKHEKLHHEQANNAYTTNIDRNQDEIIGTTPVDFTYNPAIPTNVVKTQVTRYGGLETWIAPEVQKVRIDPKKEELIECKDGTLILVPKNSFVDANRNPITEKVTLEIIEALTMDKIVAYNLSTMSNDRPLKSGGMVYVQPKVDEREVFLADGKSLHIEVPTDNYDPEMKAWEGVPDGNGNLNWENPQEIENYLIPVSLSTLDFLPNGFREEVASTLPFKKYKTSSQRLEDSLYFSLGLTNNVTINQNSGNNSPDTENKVELVEPTEPKNNQNTKRGLGNINKATVFIENLPDGEGPFRVTLTQSDFDYTYTTTLEDNSVKIRHYVGDGSVSVYSDKCSITFKDLEFKRDTEYTLDCINIKCQKDEPKLSKKTKLMGNPSEKDVFDKCFLDPSVIYAIRQPQFENTFIATREFQERLKVLHTIKNPKPYFDLYINQLDVDLHKIDAQVADLLTGVAKRRFEAFAAEKLTNVKPNGQNYRKLREYYNAQLAQQRKTLERKRNEEQRMSTAELEAVQSEIILLKEKYHQEQHQINQKYSGKAASSSASSTKVSSADPTSKTPRRFIRNNTRPRVARQSSYKVKWFKTGWMNIDAFLHELEKGERIIPFIVKNDEGAKIYQSVNSLNTLLMLNSTDHGYQGHFPTANPDTYKNSIALGIRRSKHGQVELAARFFNPKYVNEVTLSNWEKVSEKEFMRRLREVYPGGEGMLKEMEQESERVQRELERRERSEEMRRNRDAELKALEETFSGQEQLLKQKELAIKRRQEAERLFVQHLEDFINPCHPDFRKQRNFERGPGYSVMEVPGVVYSPDVLAQFPGGISAMNRFITENVIYPQKAIEQGLETTVFVNCIVERDGSFSIIRLYNPSFKDKLLNDEALRVIKLMPRWIPGRKDGKIVRSHVRIPINFELE